MQIQDLHSYDENRFEKLEASIEEYENVKGSIKTGMEDKEKIKRQKKRILEKFQATEEQWRDHKWQMAHRFETVEDIGDIIELSDEEKKQIEKVGETFRYAISPYYMALIDPDDPNCPIRKQAMPCHDELDETGMLDPMDEAGWSPVEGITRRYPDRLIIKVTNMCGMYCRFCQRRRMIGEHDVHVSKEVLVNAIEYVRDHDKIRDVLITGGDAFMLSDQSLDWLLGELRKIEHVEIIRLGTRTPVTLPQRITPELVNILKKYHPIYVNTHFNSQREITEESKEACEMLANAGIPLGNQMVLLNGVNNDPFIVRKLNQQLLKIRVKPYYIFHPKTVKGTSHFWVNMEEGMEIMESLRGRTSGMAIPTYIVNGSEGMGKTPIMPNYLLYMGKDKVVMRNWEGRPFQVENKK
ncbi:KamA family radical SAM protein [Alkalibacter rhizosphaerae]|uniref:KamA family radical SAM protein n=1 Tax=Alkalibacter rhizosphaerae TaxID=2815577 RepID=A0A975AI09_9FIRM|nr:KamA family radical SAM protein [Alkalibacter rhizosphaerae]QSX08992.1 KamA family radical SAM protein [Alkalibacter rhizosphaerae]